MRLFVDEHMVRAWPGGAGDAKIAGNYAPTIEPLVAAARHYGAQQSLFVLPRGPDRDEAVVSEAGGMNFMVFVNKVGLPCWVCQAGDKMLHLDCLMLAHQWP